MEASLIIVIVLAIIAVITLGKMVRIIPQAREGIVERLGRYNRTLTPGLSIIAPFVDKVRYRIDLREQVVSFPPQPVITEDNLVVSIDTVIYFQVTDSVRATYEIANYIQAIEQLTMTTLRNIVGGMDLERTLTSREEINTELRGVLDEATGKWGVRVNRVELKGIDPPPSIQDSMEKQMRADRDKRAAILTAEGVRQSQILTAEGEKQSAILKAEGAREAVILEAQAQRESQILRAQGESQAIDTVFRAIHEGRVDQPLLSYQYLQMLPQIAQGESNKLWIVPSELGKALEGFGGLFSQLQGGGQPPADAGRLALPGATSPAAADGADGSPAPDGGAGGAADRAAADASAAEMSADAALKAAHDDVAEAIAAAEDATRATPANRPARARAGSGPAAGPGGGTEPAAGLSGETGPAGGEPAAPGDSDPLESAAPDTSGSDVPKPDTAP